MNIVGRRVSHKKFGPGEIASLEKNGDITIAFDGDEKATRRFQFPQPFVDGKYLTTDDAELAEAIEKLIETGDISPIMADSLRKAEDRPEQEPAIAPEQEAPSAPELGASEPKEDAQPKAATEAKPKTKTAPAAKSGENAEPKAEAATEAKPEAKAPAKTAPKAAQEAKPEAKAPAKAVSKAASEAKPEAKAPAKAAAKASAKAAPEEKAEAKPPAKTSSKGASAKSPSKASATKAKPAPEASAEASAASAADGAPKKSSKSDYRPPERVDGIPHTFFVFQTKTFQQGAKGGYIWAPYSLTDGTTQTCWDILEFVMPGDIIIHGEDAKIKAISQVESRCYEAPRPPEFDSKPRFSDTGRKIDCAYVLAGTKVPTKNFIEDIKRLAAPRKYAPFNSNGTGNTGYLYDLDPELAQIFIRGVANANPQIIKIEFIKDFLGLKLGSEAASK